MKSISKQRVRVDTCRQARNCPLLFIPLVILLLQPADLLP